MEMVEKQPPSTEQTEAVATRQAWMAVLARASRQELEEAWTALVPAPEYRLVRRPETGLVMVRGRAGGNGQAFNAGEMTVTRCTVSLSDEIMGTAYVAGRDQRRAELAAVFDGLLQMPEHSGKLHSDVVTPLAEAQRQKRESRSRKAAATKVEFFTMVRGDE